MLPVLLLLLSQVPCAPADSTVLCHCKQGVASACEVLRQTDPQMAKAVENALLAIEAGKKVEEELERRQAAETVGAGAKESSNAPEPPDCRGQDHHIISRPIAKALKAHLVLRGHYTARDDRFVAKAKDEAAHCGYQDWHRKVDEEVISWLTKNPKATPKQFEDFLRELYSRPDLRARFPNGI